jgi:hypothetical protein
MIHQFSGRIENNLCGLNELAQLEEKTRSLFLDDLTIDFSGANWFEANLCAALGAILHRASSTLNNVKLENLSPGIESIFRKNGFLSHFGGQTRPDYYGTTITYSSFGRAEVKAFHAYLQSQLLARSDLPKMTDPLKKKIAESIIEIFNNAVTHGNCAQVFSCGQYFPARKRIDFSVVNLGTTIHQNVTGFLGRKMSAVEAIHWALQEGNTTRTGSIPGGLGLSILRQFLKLNQGCVHIYSGRGCWTQSGATETFNESANDFAGTMVVVEFNLNDGTSYRLSTE